MGESESRTQLLKDLHSYSQHFSPEDLESFVREKLTEVLTGNQNLCKLKIIAGSTVFIHKLCSHWLGNKKRWENLQTDRAGRSFKCQWRSEALLLPRLHPDEDQTINSCYRTGHRTTYLLTWSNLRYVSFTVLFKKVKVAVAAKHQFSWPTLSSSSSLPVMISTFRLISTRSGSIWKG